MAVDLTAEGLTGAISDGVAVGVGKMMEEFYARMAAGQFVTAEAMHAKVAEMEATHAAMQAKVEELERSQAEEHAIRPEMLRDGRQLKRWPIPADELTADAASESEAEMQKLSDLMYITARFCEPDHRIEACRKLCKAFRLSSDSLVVKALDTYTSTGVSEWVPTVMSSQFHELLDTKLRIAPLVDRFTMTAKTVELPTATGVPTVYRTSGSENAEITEDTASAYSGKVTWTAEDLACRRDYSSNVDQDSIVSLGQYISKRLAYGLAYNIDRAILDGDTSTTHMDSAAVGTTDARKAWIGFRKKSLTDTGANKDLSTFTVNAIASIMAAMGDYGEDPTELVMIVSPNTYWSQIVTLVDSNNNPVWLPANTAGSPNPVVTGQVATLFGIPVVMSGLIRKDLSQSGYYQGAPYEVNNTVLHVVRRDAWLLGTRKEITIKSDEEITYNKFRVVATWRGDLQHLESTGLSTALGYNIAVA